MNVIHDTILTEVCSVCLIILSIFPVYISSAQRGKSLSTTLISYLTRGKTNISSGDRHRMFGGIGDEMPFVGVPVRLNFGHRVTLFWQSLAYTGYNIPVWCHRYNGVLVFVVVLRSNRTTICLYLWSISHSTDQVRL